MAEPKCGNCRQEGLEYVVAVDSAQRDDEGKPRFQVVLCNACGDIYGVLPPPPEQPVPPTLI